ncbi:hypothetical protein [Leuconostoc pseudomesenteroides]|uniref:hypothetical protein n=1 Tax=Leuconostoc pseudomesenteroides TaxID=33968 RepID=UPI0039E8D05A
MQKMKSLIIFEYRRILRSKMTWLVVAGLIILVSIPFFSLTQNDKAEKLNTYRVEQSTAQQSYDSLKNIPQAHSTMIVMKKIESNAQHVIDALQKNDNFEQAALKYWNSVLIATQNGQLQGDSLITINMNVDRFEWAVKHHAPVNNPSKAMTAVQYFVYVMWQNVPTIVWVFAFILLIINLYIPENGMGGRKLLSRIPLARWKKILIKTIVAMSSFVIIMVVSFAPVGLLLGVTNGFGNFHEPLFTTVDGEKIIHQSSGNYLINIIVLTIVLIAIILFIQLILVNFVNYVLPQIGILLGIIILAQNTSIFSKGITSKYIPVNYLDLNRILIGKSDVTNLYVTNGGITVNFLSMLLLIWMIVTLLIGLMLSSKRRIL